MNIKKISRAGIVAIPLVNQESVLNPKPNYFVIDSISGKFKENIINPITEQLELQDCVQINFKLVYRSILEATDNAKEELDEMNIRTSEALLVPVDFVPLFFTHERIKQNVGLINKALSHFSFRGLLANYNLVVDENVLDSILVEEE